MSDPRNVKDVQRKCRNCGCGFMARSADVKRGWAKFCSKSCKASDQTRRTGYGGPEAHRSGGQFLGFDTDINDHGDK